MRKRSAYVTTRNQLIRHVRPGQMYLWITPEEANRLASGHEAILSAEERNRALRFHRIADQNRFIIAHAFVRLALSWHFGVAAAEWCFRRSRNGRPLITAPVILPRVQFSLSHTEGLTACLITLTAESAVDVEKVVGDRELVLAAGQVLSAAEQKNLGATSGREWTSRFFDHWTLKEAYAKARGLGLGLRLSDVGFDFAPGGKIQAQFEARLNDDPSNWLFWCRRLSQQHTVSVAAKEHFRQGFELIIKRVNCDGVRLIFGPFADDDESITLVPTGNPKTADVNPRIG
jgi:4'-phosphopantetheinyl transferase